MSTPATTDITFENGYARLHAVAARLGQDEVPVSEMVDLYAEGKGLESALLAHLDEANGRVEQIERGEHVQQFRIVASTGDGGGEAPADTAPHVAPFTGDFSAKPPAVADDDIPF